MSERNGTTLGTGTAEIPVVRPTATPTPVPGPQDEAPEPNVVADGDLVPGMMAPGMTAPGMQPTAPVTVRPRPRMPRRGPLTVMGPWAPVAGGLLGLVSGVVAVVLLGGTADRFTERLSLAFVVLGLVMLGTSVVLLADEVRMMRQRARDAVVRPALVEATAGLLNGLTPARLLLGASAFVLFLAAYVVR
jgi:hypothetical protein